MDNYLDHILTISIVMGLFTIAFYKDIIKTENYLGVFAKKQERKIGSAKGLYGGLLLFIIIHTYLISLSLWFIILTVINLALLITGFYFNLKVMNYEKPSLIKILISIGFPISYLIYEFTPSKEYIGRDNIIKAAIDLSIISIPVSFFIESYLTMFIVISNIIFHLWYNIIKDEYEDITDFYDINDSVVKYFLIISFPILFFIYLIFSNITIYLWNKCNSNDYKESIYEDETYIETKK